MRTRYTSTTLQSRRVAVSLQLEVDQRRLRADSRPECKIEIIQIEMGMRYQYRSILCVKELIGCFCIPVCSKIPSIHELGHNGNTLRCRLTRRAKVAMARTMVHRC